MPIDKRLGQRVRELRKSRGWSQLELARRTGGSRPQVSRDERTGCFNTRRVLKYAEVFGVDPGSIVGVLEDI